MDVYEGNILLGAVKQYSNVPVQTSISFMTSEKVSDDIRGYLGFNSTWHFYSPKQYTPKNNDHKKLALILESPHKDEYRINNVLQKTANEQLIPQRPANGFAGVQIDNFIQNRPWIKHLNTTDVYEVFIMNAIQYQCSAVDYIQGMNKFVRRLTDNIFLVMWNYNKSGLNPFRTDFVNRIQKYSPDVIINACTKGTRKPTLQMRVETLIRNMAASYYTDYHPASTGKNIWK